MAVAVTISVLSGSAFNNLTNTLVSIGFVAANVKTIEPYTGTIAGVTILTLIKCVDKTLYYSPTATATVIGLFG